MTRAETKRDVHHLYGHWPERTAASDNDVRAVMFYAWLESMDTGILSFGNFGEGAVFHHIASWVDEWEKAKGLGQREH